jgi:hypothetical protein
MMTCLLGHDANVNLKNKVSPHFEFVMIHSLVNHPFGGLAFMLRMTLWPVWLTGTMQTSTHKIM